MVMKKNRILTSSFRKIKSTYKRFISLMCMALLGVGFFAGIQATSPDMLKTLDTYLDKNDVYDIEIVSTLGLTDNDINKIKEIENIDKVEGIYSKDVIMKTDKEEYIIKMIGINDNINKISLIEGNLPKKDDEIVVEKKFIEEEHINIGDTIKFEDNELLKKEYKIVGIVQSPLYFSRKRGNTNLGKGQINYYAYAQNSVFNQNYYNSIYLTVQNAKNLTTSTNEYKELIETTKNKIDEIKQDRQDARFNEVYGEYINLAKLQNQDIDQSNLTTPTWYITDRTNNQGYTDFIDATQSIEKIGNVFPLVFYIIAVLVSLVSMTRMIDEDRQELGTLKALGFNNLRIMIKYIIYSLSATTIGGILGMTIGFRLIPSIIWNIYQMLFTIPDFIIEFNVILGMIGLLIGILCICGSCIIATHKELIHTPSILMRPKAQKAGKRTILEHIHFIWNHLKFSNKITIRNLFGYKIRVFVTIIGIAGCTALILAGFGLKDSISSIVNYQFENVSKYDKMITLKSDKGNDGLKQELKENENIIDYVPIRMETVKIYNNDKNYEINLVVTDNPKELEKVISLNDINNNYNNVNVEEDKVILSEKTAKLLEVKQVNEISFKDEQNNEYKLQVQAQVENYINNYAYLSKNTYEKIFGEYKENVVLVTTKDLSDENSQKLDESILNNESVASITTSKDIINSVKDMMDSLDSVVLILVVSAAILAFVVMYNLSNINISERKREIATLKVLGFYDKEVDNYITKENIILTIIGIALGLIFGVYLGHFIITTCEIETLMFVRHVNTQSYIYATLITTIFTIIVNIFTHKNLKKIDMIESLKSVE